MNKLPDSFYISLKYFYHFKRFPNLKNPKSFTEKIQWLKLNDRKQEYTVMVDKYLVKDYVASIIGSEYIIPTLGVWDDAEDIEFDDLPNQFVLKWNHDSGSVVICKDKNKLDRESVIKRLASYKKHNGYNYGREWPYKNVKPMIIAEHYMKDSNINGLNDYKFFCFNGRVKCFKIDFDRFINHRANYYDINGNLLPFGELAFPPDFSRKIEMPHNLQLMVYLAEKLADGIPFIRVDFYEVDTKVYFGELTFYPSSGFGCFTDEKWDYKLGEWIVLP
jgi:hypothetical protein